MMKKNVLMLFFVLISIQIFANPSETLGGVIGKVVDHKTKQPIPYVNVILKNENNQTVTGGLTDDQGMFALKKIKKGSYVLELQFIGYETNSLKIEIKKNRSALDLGTVALKEDVKDLDEVVVIAETSSVEQKIDRKVINVGKDLVNAGTTASEMLNNVQSVSVDSQSGELSLRGNTNVRVLVDGKPSNMSTAQLLNQIPSASIKSIELITNPSAKYNPEGMSGIINLVLHKNSNLGFNGVVNVGVTRGLNTRPNASLDMNLKVDKVNFFANYGYNDGWRDNTGFVNRTGDNANYQDFAFRNKNTSHLLKLGADIYLNKKNTLSFYTIQNRSDNVGESTVSIFEEDLQTLESQQNTWSKNNAQTYNANYVHQFNDKGHNLEIEANYQMNKNPQDAAYYYPVDVNNIYDIYYEQVEDERDNVLLNLDYTLPLENSKLEWGLEYRQDNTDNLNDNAFGDNILRGFGYERRISSTYVNYNTKLGKVSVQAGARLEQFNANGSFMKGGEELGYKYSRFNLYPSVFLTYNPNRVHQYQLSYSRRVDRPSIQQLNPIREWSTPQITSVGNPELDPQFTHSFEANYTLNFKKGNVSVGGFYRRVNDNISRVLNEDPLDNNKVTMSYLNADSNNRYGLEISNFYRPTNWWMINSSAEWYRQNQSGVANGNQLEVTNNAINARMSHNFVVSRNLRVQLFGMYRGGGRSIQFNRDHMWMVTTGASYNVLKGKGTISFRMNDIFKGMKFKFDSANPFPQNGQFNWESRTAYLGFMYRFGGGKNKSKRRKQRDQGETRGSGGFM